MSDEHGEEKVHLGTQAPPAKTIPPTPPLPDPSQDDEDVLMLAAAYFLMEAGQ